MCAAAHIKVCDGVIVDVDVCDIVRVHVNSACPYVPHSEYQRVQQIGVHVIMCGTANINMRD